MSGNNSLLALSWSKHPPGGSAEFAAVSGAMAPNQCYLHKYVSFLFVMVSVTNSVICYEKTLRKMVRSQSKMVQRPFDDMGGVLTWTNISNTHPLRLHNLQMFPSTQTQLNTLTNNRYGSKTAGLLSTIEVSPGKARRRPKASGNEPFLHSDVRLARNALKNSLLGPEVLLSEKTRYNVSSRPPGVVIEGIHPIQMSLSYFPSLNETGIDDKHRAIGIPNDEEHFQYNDSLSIQGLIKRNVTKSAKPEDEQKQRTDPTGSDIDQEKADFLLGGTSVVDTPVLEINNTAGGTCTIVKTSYADIDAQALFTEFDVEPPWTAKKVFWNHMFESRYEFLMRNPKWPPLKVILVPRTHVNSIWKKTFEQYNDSVGKMLSNIVKKLQFYSNLTFTWNEVSHLSRWYKNTSFKRRMAFRRLLKEGKIEITTGGWVETDEATTHYFGLIHLLIEGHQWLQAHLRYSPRTAWLTNTVTHSPTMAYLLSTLGITNLVFTNIHYAWEKYLAEYQYSEFIWLQNWSGKDSSDSRINTFLNRMGRDSYPKSSIIAHYLQFNSDGFRACGPNKDMCATEFNFAKHDKQYDINLYNVKEKSELLLEQYSKTGTITSHNVVIAPIGGPQSFRELPEFDYQYSNYLKIADYINVNRDIYRATVQFGTPSDFFTSIAQSRVRYPTLKGDFLNFADVEDGYPSYWTGFFTSRPLLKILLRRLQSTLRSTEILFSFAVSRNSFVDLQNSNILELLVKSRESVAQLLDRNVISGTLTANTLKYVHQKILETIKDCWYIQEIAVSSLTSNKSPKVPYVQTYVYRDGEFISTFRTVGPGDQLFIFNSLSQDRAEVVELYTRTPNIRIVDHNRKDVAIQVNPVWKYNSDNIIIISRRYYKVTFVIDVPPLTLELFKIKESYVAMQNIATVYCLACIVDDLTNNVTIFPFNVQSIEPGDIQLESYKHRLIFDEVSGFLKSIVEKDTNVERSVELDYGAFRSSGVNSGMFLFNTNGSRPLHDILKPYREGKKSKLVIIVSGQITTELSAVYGRLLQHTVKIFNLYNSPLSSAIYVESRVDYEVSPKYKNLELYLSIQTDIANGSPPEIYTDNNGFQYTARVLNISRRVESNVYPMTTMSFIQDRRRRLTVAAAHAQGVSALREGQLLALLQRRALRDDARGAGEGLAAGAAAAHRHYILLESFADPPTSPRHALLPNTLQLPSLRANYLSATLNNILEIFFVNRTRPDQYYYVFLPLIKSEFPCDVSLVNYRLILDSDNVNTMWPTSALMILHRQSYSCQIENDALIRCNTDTTFIIDNILRNTKSAYQTNLCGSLKGTQVNTINLINFPAMELITLRINF